MQEYCFLKVRAKYYSKEIRTIFQDFRSYITEYGSIQKCFSSGKMYEPLKPIGSTPNTTHSIWKQLKKIVLNFAHLLEISYVRKKNLISSPNQI
jgi:transposase